jgi:hypothetical protein
MSRRGRAIHRVDNTAKVLIAAAKGLGLTYMPLNDVIDGLLLDKRGRLHAVEWKSPGGTLTDTQAKYVAAGFPIRFISTVDQLQHLLREEE